ncbi:50S ribosomal protein L14 [Candidatus Woesearchaeota archaeon]|jgi:large subunit ribosomal protein L14|nr:50S ribosomal protein L14 [Candidatus Woesearchaeota archaeon]MBT4387746.1 50S ribosomal protein L14 [Candidatus Woesearchaeota archaeon]MBT4595565.1 50S ribosomal protein L14 [Candidatus Woesearchaeota archaeon]MBT5740952.1 50S ribosomal protein L14 [Candidatus Woesearchaeota archaeon]MBT6505769.1 50S ribosomal protein L14 [Candidatus Woesearchaeota archaeon]
MKEVKSKITRGLPFGARIEACDNSGAKLIRLFSVKNMKTRKGRLQAAGIGDLIKCTVKKGKPDMRKKVVWAVIVRTKKSFRRANGKRIKFEDNAVVVLKDEKGTPKGTIIKGPIAKEVALRWPTIAKIANSIL